MNKKQIPLYLQDAIEPIFKKNSDIINFKKEDNCYYSFYDRDESSDFFFKIFIDHKKANLSSVSSGGIACLCKPRILDALISQTVIYEKGLIGKGFEEWVNNVRILTEKESIYDDPFTKSYQEFFEKKYKIEEDDANTAPFDPDQQDYIESYLEDVSRQLLELKEATIDETEKAFIDLTVQEIKETVTQLPVTTKNKAWSKILKLWAKLFVWKKGMAKEFMKQAQQTMIKELVARGFKLISESVEDFKNIVESGS